MSDAREASEQATRAALELHRLGWMYLGVEHEPSPLDHSALIIDAALRLTLPQKYLCHGDAAAIGRVSAECIALLDQ
jgi:hypothetical protein